MFCLYYRALLVDVGSYLGKQVRVVNSFCVEVRIKTAFPSNTDRGFGFPVHAQLAYICVISM